MDLSEAVRRCARANNVLVEASDELSVTSMSVIELVMALEDETGVEIPNTELTEANFKSVASVVAMVVRLRGAAS